MRARFDLVNASIELAESLSTSMMPNSFSLENVNTLYYIYANNLAIDVNQAVIGSGRQKIMLLARED